MPRLIGFIPYLVVATVHVAALALGDEAVAAPTKLALMPLLALAVAWGARGARWTMAHTLLVGAIALSWLGDGAGPFFPGFETVPMMLLWFGLAHVCYIWLFWRLIAVKRPPVWSLVYVAWWVALLAVLWPHLGGLLGPVAIYGIVLGATAAGAARCHPLVAWGGALFLISDSILAFRLFAPDALPGGAGALVMLTYCAGQGLIAAGVLATLRQRERATTRGEEASAPAASRTSDVAAPEPTP
jgi:uncharacterized membrane protein YhhN